MKKYILSFLLFSSMGLSETCERINSYTRCVFQGEKSNYPNDVYIIIPDHFKKTTVTNFILYLHGFGDHVTQTFPDHPKLDNLASSFISSQKNAIFIAPLSRNNSRGEKDEFTKYFPSNFQIFFKHFSKRLNEMNITDSELFQITVAVHSGGHRAVEGILQNNTQEVLFLDATYSTKSSLLNSLKHFVEKDNKILRLSFLGSSGTRTKEPAFTILSFLGFDANKLKICEDNKTKETKLAYRNSRIVVSCLLGPTWKFSSENHYKVAFYELAKN